ncbi:MAG: hypothetical protein HY211_02075 [Candidatus Omnitrophica bacterium]|nr:hypothetical protein [Candidatus Omnitrophota bacterium]
MKASPRAFVSLLLILTSLTTWTVPSGASPEPSRRALRQTQESEQSGSDRQQLTQAITRESNPPSLAAGLEEKFTSYKEFLNDKKEGHQHHLDEREKGKVSPGSMIWHDLLDIQIILPLLGRAAPNWAKKHNADLIGLLQGALIRLTDSYQQYYKQRDPNSQSQWNVRVIQGGNLRSLFEKKLGSATNIKWIHSLGYPGLRVETVRSLLNDQQVDSILFALHGNDPPEVVVFETSSHLIEGAKKGVSVPSYVELGRHLRSLQAKPTGGRALSAYNAARIEDDKHKPPSSAEPRAASTVGRGAGAQGSSSQGPAAPQLSELEKQLNRDLFYPSAGGDLKGSDGFFIFRQRWWRYPYPQREQILKSSGGELWGILQRRFGIGSTYAMQLLEGEEGQRLGQGYAFASKDEVRIFVQDVLPTLQSAAQQLAEKVKGVEENEREGIRSKVYQETVSDILPRIDRNLRDDQELALAIGYLTELIFTGEYKDSRALTGLAEALWQDFQKPWKPAPPESAGPPATPGATQAGLEEEVKVLHGHKGPVRKVAFNTGKRNRGLLASASDGEIRIWDSKGTARRPVFKHEPDEQVLVVAFRRTGSAVLVVGNRSAVSWDVGNNMRFPTRIFYPPELRIDADSLHPDSIALSPGRTSMVIAGKEGAMAVIQNLDPDRKLKGLDKPMGILGQLQPEKGAVLSVAVKPEDPEKVSRGRYMDGWVAALGTSTGTVELWKLLELADPFHNVQIQSRRFLVLQGNSGKIISLAFDPSSKGKILAAGDDQGRIRIWNAMRRSFQEIPLEEKKEILALTFSPDGRILASAGEAGTIQFWDAVTGWPLGFRRPNENQPTKILSLAFNLDGTQVAAGRDDGTILIAGVPVPPVPAAGMEEREKLEWQQRIGQAFKGWEARGLIRSADPFVGGLLQTRREVQNEINELSKQPEYTLAYKSYRPFRQARLGFLQTLSFLLEALGQDPSKSSARIIKRSEPTLEKTGLVWFRLGFPIDGREFQAVLRFHVDDTEYPYLSINIRGQTQAFKIKTMPDKTKQIKIPTPYLQFYTDTSRARWRKNIYYLPGCFNNLPEGAEEPEVLEAFRNFQKGLIEAIQKLPLAPPAAGMEEPLDSDGAFWRLEQYAQKEEVEIRPASFWFDKAGRQMHRRVLELRRSKDPHALPELLKIMDDPSVLDDVRVAAARALIGIPLLDGSDIETALDAVERLSRHNDHPPRPAPALALYDPGSPLSQRRSRFRRQLIGVRNHLISLLQQVPPGPGLSPDQIFERLSPLLQRPPVRVLAVGVVGVAAGRNGILSDETGQVYDHFISLSPVNRLLLLSSLDATQLHEGVLNRLPNWARKGAIPIYVNEEGSSKGRLFLQWVEKERIGPSMALFMDDDPESFRVFPNSWPGTLVYLGRYDPELSQLRPNVIQISRPDEGRPFNRVEIARIAALVEFAKQRFAGSATLQAAASGNVSGQRPVEFLLYQARLTGPAAEDWSPLKAGASAPLGAGLEEAFVTGPAKGFTTKVERVIETGIPVAKRKVGRLLPMKTVWDLAGATMTGGANGLEDLSAEDSSSANRVMEWANDGLRWLNVRSSIPVIQRVWKRLQEEGRRVLPVEMRANHAMTLDFTDEEPAVRLDTTVASELNGREFNAGRPLLYAVGLFHEAAMAAGFTPREAIHLTLGLYQGMTAQERQNLQAILRSIYIDHGNTWALFLQDASDSKSADLNPTEFSGMDTLTLEERLNEEPSSSARGQITAIRNYRDKWVSWLMGQLLIDLPYDRIAFRQAMEEGNVDARRRAAYEVIRDYDRDVEQGNAERMSTVVREEWLPEDLPYPVLVGGRESRAFGNQAQLFANSAYVLKTAEIVHAAQLLLEVARGKELLAELEKIANAAPISAQEELRKAVGRVKELLAHLGPGADRIRQLVFGPGKVVASTQYAGALQQLRENLEIFHSQASKVMEQAKDQVVAASTEGVSRRLPQENLTVGFRETQQRLTEFADKGGRIADAMDQLWKAILQGESYAAAYSVLMQRPSPTGSEKFKANELEEKPEQEEVLRKLTRLGGQNLYMSPSYDWVAEATDIIEAAPLFIYERTIEVDEHTVTVFEVDQEGLEQTVRQMADYWALNIDKTMDSEHLALAREIVVRTNPALMAAAAELMKQGLPEEAAHRRAFQQMEDSGKREVLLNRVALVAAWIASEFDRRIEEVERFTEEQWRKQHFIDRVEALRALLLGDSREPIYTGFCKECISRSQSKAETLRTETDRLQGIVLAQRRPLPAFHMLTTEAPGLVEGFIQVVLEEEMALRNLLRGEGRRLGLDLEQEVKDGMKKYADRIQILGWKVIREFGYEPIVEQYEAQGFSRERAIQQVIGDHLSLQEELARLAVLVEMAEVEAGPGYILDPEDPDHPLVTGRIGKPGRSPDDNYTKSWTHHFEQEAFEQVWQRNKLDPDLAQRITQLRQDGRTEVEAIDGAIEESPLYSQEIKDTVRWLARRRALENLDERHPELHLQDRVRRWYRDHTALARTTARRETVSAHSLHPKMLDPRYAYCSGTIQETKDGRLRPTGGRKRYHLIYANSRVNLGKGEKESVEVLPQWVGVTDPLAAAHGKRFYELINFNPQIRTIVETENLKVSENQWMAMVRAIRNVQAYFVDRLGRGDIEDLAYQFDQRGGLTAAALKQGESYQAGPTAGYCIPKDILFKLFVATHQDAAKLSQIGVPKHLHRGVIQMAVELAAAQENFETVMEWESWAALQLLSQKALEKRFGLDGAKSLGKHFGRYISVTGGIPVFHVTKIRQLLELTGVPSPLLARLQDLHSALWSNWAERKLTLPAEQVNRSVVFTMTRQIPEAAKEAKALNPTAGIVDPDQLRVHFYGTYKGDENYPSQPDVRFAWIMRAVMILSGFGKEVALSLDEEGQILARLAWEGFRPDSNDPEDQKVRRYLAKELAGVPDFELPRDQAIVNRLKEAFPVHTTVGDITITVVPGVSSEDLLGFSSETKELLGNVATQTQELLQSKGISPAQMKADAQQHWTFPQEWVPLNDLSPEEQRGLKEAVAGKIHPLVLRLRGPGDKFLEDLQSQDVVVFSVTHPEIMALDPAHLRDLMLEGHPNSALTALDFVAQGRHRVWFDRDIMNWYAAGRGVDENGQPILNWEERDSKGRQAVYRAFGFGTDDYRPLLGTGLREEVVRQELRAREMFKGFEQVAGASEEDLPRAVQAFQARFGEWFERNQMVTEADLAIQYEQQMLSNRRWKPRDEAVREALVDITTGLPAEKFGKDHWLATGGMFLLNGAPQEQIDRVLAIVHKAQQRMTAPAAAGLEESNPRVALLIKPRLTAAAIRFAERKGEMFSVKASESDAVKAVQRRKGLALEATRLAALKARQEGFNSVEPITEAAQIPQALVSAREQMDQMLAELQTRTSASSIHQHVGRVMGTTVQVLRRLAEELISDEKERERVQDQVKKLCQGREIDLKTWNIFGGSYEDHGILARLFELAGPSRRDEVTAAMELLYLSSVLERTASFLVLPAEEVDERLLLRALAGFFAETIDDHFYEYNPWAFDPKRGLTFKDFYDELGALKPERAEELYQVSWEHHRTLYRYVRHLILTKTEAKNLSIGDQYDLFGQIRLGQSVAQDELIAQAIGAGAPGRYERLWRAYNQTREMVFIRNDGFTLPMVFEKMDPEDPEILDVRHRVNHAFLAPVGRTHYSRALMEAGQLGENLFITRDGEMATPAGAKGPVLQIRDAQFWLTEWQYRQALIRCRGMNPADADRQIAEDQRTGRLTPKGIRAAARFTRPVTIGSVVPMHHHYLEPELVAAGYPATDKSPVLYKVTYDKSIYPEIYNPAERTGVHLPDEIDWYREDTEAAASAPEAKQAIAVALRPFARKHGIIVAKGSAESGARNFKRFDFVDEQGKQFTQQEFEKRLAEAAEFIYQVSTGQNVTIQRAIVVTPIAWMDPKAVQEFVERQIREWAVPVNLQRHPKSWVYGTLRIIPSAGMPKDLNNLDNPVNWQPAYPISLNSLQVATNVGRQGTLEMLTPGMVRPEFRETFIPDLEAAGRAAMAATAKYGKKYWDEVYAPEYMKKHGVAPPEFDATGVPYWWPRNLMLDFLPEPVWGRDGQEVPGARVIDVIPGDPKKGTQARFTLQDPEGNVIENGQVLRFTFWLLEPNVGIGLWDRYWKREEVHEKAAAKTEKRPVDWSRVGVSDRIVLSNYLAVGEAFLKAKFGGDYFGPAGLHRGGPDQPSSPTGTSPRPIALWNPPSEPMSPPVEVLSERADDRVQELLPFPLTLAVVVGKETLMNHHLYPWIVGAQGRAVNVIGVHEDWLTSDERAARLMAFDPKTRRLIEFSVDQPVPVTDAFIVELPQSDEVPHHQRLSERLKKVGIHVINLAGPSKQRADDKSWLRRQMDRPMSPDPVAVPQSMFVSRGTPESKFQGNLSYFAKWSPLGLVIQPKEGTTEGKGVEWFAPDDRAGQLRYLNQLIEQQDAMVSTFRGNVTYRDRPLVLRFNVAAGEVTSASAVVGPEGSRIASLGRGGKGETELLGTVLQGLQDLEGRPVPVTAEDWARLETAARIAAEKVDLPIIGIDLVLERDPAGVLRGVVLEANARPGTLIFGERVEFPEDGPIESRPAAPVGPAFWNSIGIPEAEVPVSAQSAGLEEQRSFTIRQWQTIISNPDRSGLTALVGKMVPADQVDKELKHVRDLVEQAAERKDLFNLEDKTSLAYAPGRVRFYSGHTDFRGLGGQTINAAVQHGIWMLVQLTEDGRVIAENLDPRYRPLRFGMTDDDALPPEGIRRIRPDWLNWVEPRAISDQWEGLLKGTLAFIRTEILNSENIRRSTLVGKGVRLLVSETDLPTGKGFSSSSALPGAFGHALNALLPLEAGLSPSDLDQLDYANYLVGGRAGTADLTAINAGQLGKISVLWSFPDRLEEEPVGLPERFRFFIVDSGLTRLDDKTQPVEIRNYAAYIKSMTGMGYALGALWLRHLARADPTLAPLEQVLLASGPPAQPFGLLRELTEAGTLIGPEYVSMVGGKDSAARRVFLQRLMNRVPNDWTLGRLYEEIHEEDLRPEMDPLLAGFTPLGAHRLPSALDSLRLQTVVPLRQMVSYGIQEVERGLAYVKEAQAGDASGILQLMRDAQRGDRAVWNFQGDGSLALTSWGERNPEEAFFRSLPEIDRMIDQFQEALDARYGPLSVAGRITAAGLGGAIAIGTTAEAYEESKRYWSQQGLEVIEVQPSGGARAVHLPAMAAAGLEEVQVVALSVETTKTRLNQVAQTLASSLQFPAHLLQPALDGEYYPISAEEMLFKLLGELWSNAREHVPVEFQSTAKIELLVVQEPINPYLLQRKLVIRYADYNPKPFAVDIRGAVETRGVTEKPSGTSQGVGLKLIREMIGIPKGASMMVESTDVDGARRRFEYRRLGGTVEELPSTRPQGTEIVIQLPAGSVSSRSLSLRALAEQIRHQLSPLSAAGLEEKAVVKGQKPVVPTQEISKLLQFPPGSEQRWQVHIFDPENADVGRLVAALIQDPVVIIARDEKQEKALLNSGFVGDDRIVVRLDLRSNDIVKAREFSANLYRALFSPQYYTAAQRQNLVVWLARILEIYNIPDSILSLDGAQDKLKFLEALRAA